MADFDGVLNTSINTMNLGDNTFNIYVTNDGASSSSNGGLQFFTAPDGTVAGGGYATAGTTYTVTAVSKNDPNWVQVKTGSGSYSWVNIGTVNNAGDRNAIPATESDKRALLDTVYMINDDVGVGVVNNGGYQMDSSSNFNTALATYNAVAELSDVSHSGEVVVSHQSRASDLDTLYQHYMLLALKAYGGPPQWTEYTDPRVLTVESRMGRTYQVGRRYAETVIAGPTILSLCPGIIKYNSILSNIGNELSDSDIIGSIQAAFDSSKSGKIVEFEPCWYATKAGGNFGYLKYVNTLNIITAIAMSREKVRDENSLPLSERCFPGTTSTYPKFDWRDYDNPDNDASRIFGDIADQITSAVSGIEDSVRDSAIDYKYINFYCSGPNETSENFETSVRSTSLEDMINSNLNSAIKDVAFYTGGIIGDAAMDSIKEWSASMSQSFGAIGNLLSSATELLKGSHMVFPQIVDDCTFGRDAQFTIRFVAGSGNVESRYLMRCEFNHLLAFILPRQVVGMIDMYTTPFLVRGLCQGRWSCELGVLTGFKAKYGGADDNAWTDDGQPTEIEVSFSVTPLYSKLIMSSYDHVGTWFLRNTGMIEYILTNCGVDLRISQLDMKTKIGSALFTGKVASIPNGIMEHILDNELVNSIRELFNF